MRTLVAVIFCSLAVAVGAGRTFGQGWTWQALNYPGAVQTQAYAISGNNIVGEYTSSTGHSHGFLYDGTVWKSLDYSGGGTTPSLTASPATTLSGISA